MEEKTGIGILYEENKTLAFAARELGSYLGRMRPGMEFRYRERGADREILLEVRERLAAGRSAEAGPADAALDDVMEVEIRGFSGHIRGSNPRAVLLGVYRYLYYLGCRFLGPGREFEIVPRRAGEASFDCSFFKAADNRHRGVCIEGADSPENVLDFIDWLPKLGFNSFFLQFMSPYAFLNHWYAHTNNPLLAPEPFDLKRSDAFAARFEEELDRRGLLQHWVGHGWTAEALGRPALGWVSGGEGPEPGAEDFPAMLGGKREYYHGIPINTNLCYSNPAVVERFVRLAADYAGEHPHVDYLQVWLADDYNNHCECEACIRHSPSDLYVGILNELDRELGRRGLKTRIVFLMYMDLLWPPRAERLENPDRFLMMFAPISRTFMHSYRERGALPPIPEYRRNRITLPTGLEENLAFLREWRKQFAGDCFVYDYHLGRAHYGDLGYLGISKVLYEDIRELKELGLNGYMSCQELRAALPNALPNYVGGLALMDESLCFEEIVRDYFHSAYGRDWERRLEYLSGLSALCDWDYFNKKGDRINAARAEAMEKALRLLEEEAPVLERACSEGGERPDADGGSRRVRERFGELLVYHNRYARLLAAALRELAAGRCGEAAGAWRRFEDFIREQETRRQQCLDVYRVIEVGVNYAGFPAD